MTRHNVKYKAVSGENAFVDKDVCKEWKERTVLPILKSYKPEDIFNCDETGLYWRLLPEKTHSVVGDTCTGGKKSKERDWLVQICLGLRNAN